MRRIKVFYDERMNAVSGSAVSPSAGKPKAFVDALVAHKYPIEIISPTPVSREQLYSIHQKEFVDGVLDGLRPNGFGTISEEVCRSLPWVSGSMLNSSLAALPNEPTISPTSGAHHSEWDKAMGFCTFHSIFLAAKTLLDMGKKVAICDADCHYGQGTDQLINHHNLQGKIFHYSFGKYFTEKSQTQAYLDTFSKIKEKLGRFKPDLIIYNAGADPHELDSLGSGFLDTSSMWLRDFKMFTIAKELNCAITFALAGGYQSMDKVVKLHLNTVDAMVKVFDYDGGDGSTKIFKKKVPHQQYQ